MDKKFIVKSKNSKAKQVKQSMVTYSKKAKKKQN